MERFEVKLRNIDGHRWSMMFNAESFAEAEVACINKLPANDASIIVAIEMDWTEESYGDCMDDRSIEIAEKVLRNDPIS